MRWGYVATVVEAGQRIAKKYELIRQVGVGGMGEVWAAHHASIDRYVAIKFPNIELVKRAEVRERFLAEARILGRLQHPNIVDVIDFGELDDGGLFLVFELLDGTSLDAHVQEMGRIAPQNAVRIAIELCRGLAFAHEANVVHRDLKPANVFLHRAPGGRMRVKILDFGISKTCSEGEEKLSLTGTDAVVGTPAYMSYEQAKAFPDIDARSDIWNVGAVLYEMLTGLPPFEARTYSATVAKIVSEDVAPMMTWGAIVPTELETIVQRCLKKQREERFQSAMAVQAALEAVMPRLSEPPVSRRLQLDSIADLPAMPLPPDVIPPSHPSSSLRFYSPCAVTMGGETPQEHIASAPPPRSAESSRPLAPARSSRTLLLGAIGLLVAGAGIATVAMLALAPPSADDAAATSPVASSSHPASEVMPTPSSSAEPEPIAKHAEEAVAVPKASAEPVAPIHEAADPPANAVRPPSAPVRTEPRRTKKQPTTLVDDPGF